VFFIDNQIAAIVNVGPPDQQRLLSDAQRQQINKNTKLKLM
jgi:hypothetical protein